MHNSNKIKRGNSQILFEMDIYRDRKVKAIWNELTKDPDYTCPICGKQNINCDFVVEHNHTTGIIRGVVCRSCNYILGYIEKLSATNPQFEPFYRYLNKAKQEEIELQTFFNDLEEVF